MDSAAVLKDLREQFGPKSVLYSEDIAALLGKSRAAVESLRARGGFPVPVIQVGGRPAVSIHAMADFLSGKAPQPVALPSKGSPAVQAPKRAGESLGKYLLSVRIQREFLFELDAEIEKLIVASQTADANSPGIDGHL
jgi:hypothetical protein